MVVAEAAKSSGDGAVSCLLEVRDMWKLLAVTGVSHCVSEELALSAPEVGCLSLRELPESSVLCEWHQVPLRAQRLALLRIPLSPSSVFLTETQDWGSVKVTAFPRLCPNSPSISRPVPLSQVSTDYWTDELPIHKNPPLKPSAFSCPHNSLSLLQHARDAIACERHSCKHAYPQGIPAFRGRGDYCDCLCLCEGDKGRRSEHTYTHNQSQRGYSNPRQIDQRSLG